MVSRVEGTLNGSTNAPGSPRSPRGIARTGSGVNKGALNVDEATRQKVRERIAAGLAKNPQLAEGSQDFQQIAATCEEKCFLSCSTRCALNKHCLLVLSCLLHAHRKAAQFPYLCACSVSRSAIILLFNPTGGHVTGALSLQYTIFDAVRLEEADAYSRSSVIRPQSALLTFQKDV